MFARKIKKLSSGQSAKSVTMVFIVLLPIVGFLFLTNHEHRNSEAGSSPSTGQIRGRVEIKTVLTAVTRQRGIRYRERGKPEEKHQMKKETRPEVTNVVVYLEEIGSKESYVPPRQSVRLLQKDTEFIPHVLPVLKGSRVEIVNHDDFYHNVFSNSSVKRFNVGRQLTDAVVTETFDEIGFIPMFCDIHLEMSAYIVVLENPYFAAPDESGFYTIDNVPSGRYKIVAWHERLVTQSQEISVPEGGSVTVDFNL